MELGPHFNGYNFEVPPSVSSWLIITHSVRITLAGIVPQVADHHDITSGRVDIEVGVGIGRYRVVSIDGILHFSCFILQTKQKDLSHLNTWSINCFCVCF